MWIINGVTEHELLTVWGNSRLFVAVAVFSPCFFLSFVLHFYCINMLHHLSMASFFRLFYCLAEPWAAAFIALFYQSDRCALLDYDANSFSPFAHFIGYLSCSVNRAVIDKLNSLFAFCCPTDSIRLAHCFGWYLTRFAFIVNRKHTNFA